MADKTPDDTADETGYAVYDETLGRFVGGVHPTKADADAARKTGPESHTLRTRKV